MFRIGLRFILPPLTLFSSHLPLKRVQCNSPANPKQIEKKPQTRKLKGVEENVTGVRSVLSIIYVFLKRYYLSITKMTLRFWWKLLYSNAVLICSLFFLIFA